MGRWNENMNATLHLGHMSDQDGCHAYVYMVKTLKNLLQISGQLLHWSSVFSYFGSKTTFVGAHTLF